jgi:hypothetical protein
VGTCLVDRSASRTQSPLTYWFGDLLQLSACFVIAVSYVMIVAVVCIVCYSLCSYFYTIHSS